MNITSFILRFSSICISVANNLCTYTYKPIFLFIFIYSTPYRSLSVDTTQMDCTISSISYCVLCNLQSSSMKINTFFSTVYEFAFILSSILSEDSCLKASSYNFRVRYLHAKGLFFSLLSIWFQSDKRSVSDEKAHSFSQAEEYVQPSLQLFSKCFLLLQIQHLFDRHTKQRIFKTNFRTIKLLTREYPI